MKLFYIKINNFDNFYQALGLNKNRKPLTEPSRSVHLHPEICQPHLVPPVLTRTNLLNYLGSPETPYSSTD